MTSPSLIKEIIDTSQSLESSTLRTKLRRVQTKIKELTREEAQLTKALAVHELRAQAAVRELYHKLKNSIEESP